MAGEKMENARRAAHRLVDSLGDRDQLSLVTFGSEVKSTPLQPLTAESTPHPDHAQTPSAQGAGQRT